MTTDQTVRLLELDPELGLRVPPAEVERSRAELVARTISFEPGVWGVPTDAGDRGGMGYIVLDGVLAREMLLVGSKCAEVLGEGDVIAPSVHRDDSLVRYHTQWHVLEPLRLAVLDERFARALGSWPAVIAAVLERAERRTRRLAVHQAIQQLSPAETRLLMLFWHLAERWGRVTPNGIAIHLRLSHEMLGHLVGSRRASVTTALARVCESGQLERRGDGTWMLCGSPPGEHAPLHWQRGAHDPSRFSRSPGNARVNAVNRKRS